MNKLQFLTSSQGEQLLTRLSDEDLSDANTLKLVTLLRKEYTVEEIHAALTLSRLRLKAVSKFGVDAARMFFTEDALQQASDPQVRAYRARLLGDHVIDICCGIGADSLAFAAAGANVIGIDLDPIRLYMAQLNAIALNQTHVKFVLADARTKILRRAKAIFFDPARRDAIGKRIYDVKNYIPPLETVKTFEADHIAVKLSPGVDMAQLAAYGGRVEFISVDGELKEAILWLDGYVAPPVATLISHGRTYHWREEAIKAELSEPRQWLVEPDAAVIRAGLVTNVAVTFNGYLLDETIAYFTADSKPISPWVRAWKILDWMPFNLKQLRAYLREQGVGHVTVKKRGSPLTPETLIPQLKLKGDVSRTLVLTRYKNQPIVIICADYTV
ncbi:MAG: SAM-dependent methyltransferase [Phototrophicales bacterium]|nr:MAG: SAM-dependent methyltransferase [Phototrophicales bacterium]RMG77808.1 MAG: methyltransferase domain-containing protein [Chloroflexota bacterium]